MKLIAKLVIPVLVVVLFSWVSVTSVEAYYSQVTGGLFDNQNDRNAWAYGATVRLYDCSDLSNLLDIQNLGNLTSTFTFNLTQPTAERSLCITVEYNAPPGKPKPEQESKFFADTSGVSGPLNTGDWYAHTTPTAVTLTGLQARAGASPWETFTLFAGALALTVLVSALLRQHKSS